MWMRNNMLQHRQSAITPVSDEHVSWSVGERQRGFRLHDHRLWRDPTGPKHWHFPWRYGHRVTKVRPLDVMNAEGRWIAHVDRRAVDRREATGDLHSAYDLRRY